jgi:hypothetical protein
VRAHVHVCTKRRYSTRFYSDGGPSLQNH